MSDAQTILKMIQEVSPDDAVKLDEIDARVSAYNMWLYALRWEKRGVLSVMHKGEEGIVKPSVKYTRCRNSLKAIRPQGWELQVFQKGFDWFGELEKRFEIGLSFRTENLLPTEELAELHAIIQAIEFERNIKCP